MLRKAILQAALDELRTSGYAGLSMDRVAERARTSKASLYRRWPSRVALGLEVVAWALPDNGRLPDTGDLRADLFALHRGIADRLDGPLGEVVRGVTAETLLDPAAGEMARNVITHPTLQEMLGFLRRAADRGDLRPEAVNPWVASTGPIMLRHYFLTFGSPIPDAVVRGIVDQVLLPLMRREDQGTDAGPPRNQAPDPRSDHLWSP